MDIDLVYLPREDRPSTLRGIGAALQRIAAKIRSAMPTLEVREHQVSTDKLVFKLTVRAQGGAEVKIEPNTVLRGTLHPITELNLSPKAVEMFGRSATMRVVSLPDLFGGKLCAALDRQHRRDLFDVHSLFRAEGNCGAVVWIDSWTNVRIWPSLVDDRFREIAVAPWAHCGPSVDWARFPRALR